eukprot:m.91266 g.91266  ORF g.91266 m.91266 type:complete len:205 (-) comp14626_c2_seq2:209-823(-)
MPLLFHLFSPAGLLSLVLDTFLLFFSLCVSVCVSACVSVCLYLYLYLRLSICICIVVCVSVVFIFSCCLSGMYSELRNGIGLSDENGKDIVGADGKPITSQRAAEKAITLVAVSRILMAVPGMTIPPLIANHLEKKGVFKRLPWLSLPLQTILCGVCLVFATPLACAIFPQTSSLEVDHLEEKAKEDIRAAGYTGRSVFFNKGL